MLSPRHACPGSESGGSGTPRIQASHFLALGSEPLPAVALQSDTGGCFPPGGPSWGLGDGTFRVRSASPFQPGCPRAFALLGPCWRPAPHTARSVLPFPPFPSAAPTPLTPGRPRLPVPWPVCPSRECELGEDEAAPALARCPARSRGRRWRQECQSSRGRSRSRRTYAESEDSSILSWRPSLLRSRVTWKGCGTDELRLPPPGRQGSAASTFWTWMWSTWA